MEQVGGAGAGAREQLDPGSDEPFVGAIVDGGKDAIGRVRAILVGGLEGNGHSQWLRKLERGRVVERVDVDPGEEARRVGRLARLPERARGERRLPAGGRQGACERACDLRRAATGEEEERRDDESARCRRAAAAPRDGASFPNRLPPLHGSILVRQPDAAAGARLLHPGLRSAMAPRALRNPASPAGIGLALAASGLSLCLRGLVTLWRNCDTLLPWDQRCATPGLATNATGPGTACPPRAPATAETCTALTWPRGAVAKRSLIRLRKQKFLRQVFERLQDRFVCTFLKAD
jgi:hypothetical protein